DAEFFRIEPRRGKPPGRDAKPQADRAEPAPMPGMPRGNFRPIDPKDRARAERPGVPRPPPQPGARSAAFVAEGRAAFQAQMYGRAERLFQSAAMAVPAEPTAPFLVAQARFAVRKYREAVEAIHAGLRALPNWPNTPFRPADLYGANAADLASQIKHLEEMLARNPK